MVCTSGSVLPGFDSGVVPVATTKPLLKMLDPPSLVILPCPIAEFEDTSVGDSVDTEGGD